MGAGFKKATAQEAGGVLMQQPGGFSGSQYKNLLGVRFPAAPLRKADSGFSLTSVGCCDIIALKFQFNLSEISSLFLP